MKLNRTQNPIDRIGRIKINENWDIIESDFNDVVEVVSGEAFNQVVDSAKLIWKEPVDTFSDLATEYPNAEEGWTAMAREVVNGVNKVYRYDGSEWVLIQQIQADAVNEVDDRLKEKIAETAEEIKMKQKSIILDSDFETLPYIASRSSVYSFSITTEQQQNNMNSLKIVANNYEGSSDENKDFALLMTEVMQPGEKLRLSFWVYPTVGNKNMNIRLAYSGGTNVNLGPANQWNKIDVVLDLTGNTRSANFLYFNLGSSYTIYLSELIVVDESTIVDNYSASINQVNDKLLEQPYAIQNSNGAITKLLAVAQTYQNQLSNFVYGNSYTNFDDSTQLVGGKFQVDCSSFAHCLIGGITYENSRYSGVDNERDKFFFNNLDPYKYRYANQMARYAFEKGYAFYPNEDFSNIQTGDVLFFSWDPFVPNGDTPEAARSSAFMKIDHVAVFLDKKNENLWSTVQINNNVTSVYFDANNAYMNQCVLVARFPFANIQSPYQESNMVLNGNTPKSTTNSPDIGFYRLSRPMQKGKYYTMVVKGQINTPNCYFLMQVNNQTIYTDFGKVGSYDGITVFRFPYLLDVVSRDLKVSIGAPAGTSTSRSGSVEWISIYEGFEDTKERFEQPVNRATIYDFPLVSSLVSDLDPNYNPYYKYAIEGNKLFLNLNLPFSTLRTSSLQIGTLPPTIISPQRIPINLISDTNEAINGVLQVNTSGSVFVIVYDVGKQWRYLTANACLFIE